LVGRFLQTDPIRYGDGANIYAYVHGDPLNRIDPTGTDDQFVNIRCENTCNDGGDDGGPPDGSKDGFAGPADDGFGDTAKGGGQNSDGTVEDLVITGIRTPTPIQFQPDQDFINAIGAVQGGGSTSGDGGGGGGAANSQPQNNPNKRKTAADCAAAVAKADLAGAALDAASLIPGGGDLGDVARLGAGAASLGISASQGNRGGTAFGLAGVTLGSAVVSRNVVNAAAVGAKDGLEAIPFLGTIVGVGALGFDAFSAAKEYNACLAGHWHEEWSESAPGTLVALNVEFLANIYWLPLTQRV
jgi:hypothetical protein